MQLKSIYIEQVKLTNFSVLNSWVDYLGLPNSWKFSQNKNIIKHAGDKFIK